MVKEVRVTTVDNPYNPFTEWNEWYSYDLQKGYYTCERLASTTILSDQLSDKENLDSLEDSIKQLMKTGALNKSGEIVDYKRVYKNDNTNNSTE